MATWNERIDNIQSRLANLVNEEFSGANFYNIKLEASNYNPTIDSNITLTVTVTNANGDAIEDYEVQLYKDGSSLGSSYIGLTNSNGICTFTYACSDWGLINFSVNNASCFINVNGFKEVETYSNGFYTLYVNEATRTCRVINVLSGQSIGTGEKYVQSNFIPSAYRPSGNLTHPVNRQYTLLLQVSNAGTVKLYNSTSGSITLSITTQVEWTY